MAKNDFSSEVAENYEQKCLCVLVLDLSGSMNEIVDDSTAVATGQTIYVDGKNYNIVTGGISKLDNLVEGLQSFYTDIENDETTSQRLELAVVTFGDSVNVIQSPSLISDIQLPELMADGDTALVDAVDEAIDIVNNRKKWYKSTGQPYYRPWIILITDGEPDDDQNVDKLSERIKQDTQNKRYAFLPIGVEGANMNVLSKIQGDIKPMKLQGTKFSSFFKWLSASMGTIVNAEAGEKVDISQGAEDWMSAFTI